MSFNVPPADRSSGKGLTALPRRRRSAEARGGDEFLRSPESFLVAHEGSPIAIGDAEATGVRRCGVTDDQDDSVAVAVIVAVVVVACLHDRTVASS
jgi:hypothetical protein